MTIRMEIKAWLIKSKNRNKNENTNKNIKIGMT